MTYEKLKAAVDKKINGSGSNIELSALELYKGSIQGLEVIQSVIADDFFVESMNYLQGYGRKLSKRIAKIDGKKSPFMTGAQYFTDTRNKMMFPLVIDDNGKTRNCALETYVSDHELKYNIYFDNMHDEENDKYIVKYVELFLKSFGKEIKDRIEALDILTKTYNVTFNGFDIHKADKYQVIDDGIFRVTFESSSDERNLNVNIDFNTTELQVLSNKEYLSKESIKTYMESNKDKILSNIKVNSNDLNSFYASIARITKRRKKEDEIIKK